MSYNVFYESVSGPGMGFAGFIKSVIRAWHRQALPERRHYHAGA